MSTFRQAFAPFRGAPVLAVSTNMKTGTALDLGDWVPRERELDNLQSTPAIHTRQGRGIIFFTCAWEFNPPSDLTPEPGADELDPLRALVGKTIDRVGVINDYTTLGILFTDGQELHLFPATGSSEDDLVLSLEWEGEDTTAFYSSGRIDQFPGCRPARSE